MKVRLWLLVPVLAAAPALAGDWPQWRGPNRDGRVAGFEAPATWPKELIKKWSVTIGDGVATPALVGDKLYTFTRQGGDEVVRCLSATSGEEVWKDKYPAEAPQGPAASFAGPRASPLVVDGKVVTFGVDSALTCFDAGRGSRVWRKDSLGDVPRFSTSSSPVMADAAGEKVVIVEYGSEDGGGMVAYDLATGKRKWVWNGDGAAYASPVLMKIGDMQAVVSETAGNIVAIAPADGKLLWKTPFKVRYNAATPVVVGNTILYSGAGKGTSAVGIEKTGDGLTAKNLWTENENAVMFNTPVVKNGLVYGISDKDQLFCLDEKTGKTLWKTALKTGAGGGGGRRGGGMGGGGYGSIVDAGSVLFALNPSGELIVFEPSEKEFKKLASYKVADGGAYAYPVIAGKHIHIKDKNNVTLWAIE
jgi:outer membrane protein assembly factor BamB